ncbi:hypothetical protein PENTCL1PPCAC_1528, partial [Pristionchus entomophagus]
QATFPLVFYIHGCKYTVVKHKPAAPYSQPAIKIDMDKITMNIMLNRSQPDTPNGAVKLWHIVWPFHYAIVNSTVYHPNITIGYDDAQSDWIREASNQFRAVVEVSMSSYEDVDGRRVEIKAIGNGEKKRQINHSISLPVLSLVALQPPRVSTPRSPLTLRPDRSRESG